MATKTDVSNVYQRQRSNSDPQNAIDALNALNVENDKRKNGEMKSSSLGPKTPPPERKSKFAALGKIFKPWKWKRKKKSESIVRKAVDLERKISMRSTREELIRKGVLKEAEDNESHINNLDSLREKEEDSNNASIGCTVKDVATINQAPPSSCESYITIPPVAITSPLTTVTMSSSNTPRQLVSAAQVRPVVISMQPRKPQELSPPTLDHVQPHNIRIEVCYDQKPDQLYCDENTVNRKDEDGDEDDSTINNGEQYDNIPSSSPYEAVPAKEPDFSLLPKKSALKQNMGPFGDQQHSPSPTESRQVEFSTKPVQIISSSLAPQSTAANQVPRPSLRVTVTADDDSDKENVDDDNSSIPDYDNLPGDDYDSSDDDDEIRYIEKNPDSLAAKVARQDSLARFLNNRPTRRELVEKNIIPTKSEKEKQEDREAIGTKLTRRLSLRPTPEELEQRNILHNKTAEEQKKEKEEKKRFLIRKLSFRPSVDELKERKIIKFNDYVEVTEAHDYDRRADKPWTRLTPKDKAAIRKELNEYKSKEMEVHQESRHLTRFHRP